MLASTALDTVVFGDFRTIRHRQRSCHVIQTPQRVHLIILRTAQPGMVVAD